MNQVNCPNCQALIDVNALIYQQLDGQLKQKYNNDLSQERKKFDAQGEELRNGVAALKKERTEYQENLSIGVRQGLKEKEVILKQQLEEDQADRLKMLQDELTEKSDQVKELNKTKAEVQKITREKAELKDKIELETEQRLTTQLIEEKDKIQKFEKSKSQLQISEKEQVINQLKEQLEAAQLKAEQGSTQLQGEVQELVIEKWLAEQFPLDVIEEIKKGQQGADCMQTVNTITRQNCGSIYYESKRTRSFQPGWIEKFKADIREKNADVGILVTQAMPAGMERLGLINGVWVCSFDEFKGLCVVLRDSIIRVSDALVTQENKGDKMGMLYDLLTGNEFRLQIEAIVEGFTHMKTDLESEKRAMQGIWKKREKQIEKVVLSTVHMYSSIKGIAGDAVQQVPLLELPE